jgi:putative hydrolase of HD superfamily
VAETKTELGRLIHLLADVQRLKNVPRTGWLLRGVRDVESVADHSFGVAWIAMTLADLARERGVKVEVERVLRLALLHDLTESQTGDLPHTVKRYFESGTLQAAEKRISTEIFAGLGPIGAEYLALWREYEERKTIEARLVKAADKIDLLLQAREYERGGVRSLDEFWSNSETDFSALELDSLLAGLIDELKRWRVGGEER